MEQIFLVGENSLVAKNFIGSYENTYAITKLNKTNCFNTDIIPSDFSTLVFLAQSKDYKSQNFTVNLLDTNVKLLHHILNTCIGKTKKIIFFSSGSVYQSTDDIITEDTPLNYNTSSPYIASKLMGELIVQTFKPFYDSITIVRPFFIYGKNQKENMLFQSLINNIKNHNPIILNGGKGLVFNPIHVQDVAEFIHQSIQESYQGYRIVNLFGNELTDISEIVYFMEQELNLKANRIINTNSPSSFIANTIHKSLFQPKIGIQEGIKKMIQNI
jgi:UDP-glucose 4-epimerase